MKIEEITFDEDDKNLFLIDDLQLKADAIRNSILPKLEVINNELVSRIIELYSINFFENYSVAKIPHFRLSKSQRKAPTKTDYMHSSVSIIGQRKIDKWKGLDKGNGISAKISPTRMTIQLSSDGLDAAFWFNHPANFTKGTYRKFYRFFKTDIDHIVGLSQKASLFYDFEFINIYSIVEDLEAKFKAEKYDVIFNAIPIDYPINYEKINHVIHSNVLMFPVLNACIQIALGKKPNIVRDVEILEQNIKPYMEKYFPDKMEAPENGITSLEDLQKIKQRAESKIKVMPAIRWQVFQRDDWRCVSCGRSSEHGVILHIDHIIPRSKGGKDHIDNYQTLCDICNVGKSNKDDTDLRKRKQI